VSSYKPGAFLPSQLVLPYSSRLYNQKVMIQTLDTLFDSTTIVPEVPVNIKLGTKVRVIIEHLLPDLKSIPSIPISPNQNIN